MSREIRPILAIVAVVALVVLAVVALRPGTTETEVLPRVDLPPPGDVGPGGEPIAVVMSTRMDQETSLFGIIKGETHHIVSVQFYAPAECASAINQGDPWPIPGNECSRGVTIEGVVSGKGTAPTGEAVVLVDTETTEDCFAAISPGDYWPAVSSQCS
jgi:hypothetical protein